MCGKFVQIEGHKCFIQPETKKKNKNRSEEKEEDSVENDVSALFDTECREDNNEDDEPIEEDLTEMLFFDFECSQENSRSKSVYRSKRSRRRMGLSRRYDAKGFL